MKNKSFKIMFFCYILNLGIIVFNLLKFKFNNTYTIFNGAVHAFVFINAISAFLINAYEKKESKKLIIALWGVLIFQILLFFFIPVYKTDVEATTVLPEKYNIYGIGWTIS